MQLDLFHAEGWQVVRGLVPPELIAAERAFLETQMERSLALLLPETPYPDLETLVAHMPAIQQRPEWLSQLSSTAKSILSGHFDLQTRLAPELRLIPRFAPVRALIQTLFPGECLRMHLPPTARFILPGNDLAGVPPHQDISYNQHLSTFVTLWCPLVPVDADCGGVMIYQGSQALAEQQVAATPDFWLAGVSTAGYAPIFTPLQPGDVLLLNRWIVHASMPNCSNQVRLSIDHRFFRGSSSKHYLELESGEVVAPGA